MCLAPPGRLCALIPDTTDMRHVGVVQAGASAAATLEIACYYRTSTKVHLFVHHNVLRCKRWNSTWQLLHLPTLPRSSSSIVAPGYLRLGSRLYVPLFSEQALPTSAHVAVYLGMLLVMLYRHTDYTHSHTPLPVFSAQAPA